MFQGLWGCRNNVWDVTVQIRDAINGKEEVVSFEINFGSNLIIKNFKRKFRSLAYCMVIAGFSVAAHMYKSKCCDDIFQNFDCQFLHIGHP